MFSILLVSSLALLRWLPAEATSAPGGVNEVTFGKIMVGMTAQEIEALISRVKARNLWKCHDYSESELWHDGNDRRRIWVEYEPTVAGGKVSRASYVDYTTTPVTELELRRVATQEESAAVIDQLRAAGRAKDPLGYSDAFTKQIPVDGRRATKLIQAHPNYLSYHLMMALRTTNSSAYQELSAKVRASVLCSTLKEQRCFDNWAPPDCATVDPPFVTDSEKALIQCGAAAIPFLLPLLDDHTEALESEYEEEAGYEYRRADYAFRYISWILKIPYSFQSQPADRDRDMATVLSTK